MVSVGSGSQSPWDPDGRSELRRFSLPNPSPAKKMGIQSPGTHLGWWLVRVTVFTGYSGPCPRILPERQLSWEESPLARTLALALSLTLAPTLRPMNNSDPLGVHSMRGPGTILLWPLRLVPRPKGV